MGSSKITSFIASRLHTFLIIYLGVLTVTLNVCMIIWCPIGRYFAILYLIYTYYDYKTTSCKGKRRWQATCLAWYMKKASDFFPLIHENFPKSLSTDKSYLLCCHPHGVNATALALTMVKLQELYPEFQTHLVTTPYNSLIPGQREYFQIFGAITSSEEAITGSLGEGGNITLINPGGLPEMSLSEIGVQRIYLRRRKGFCRIALQTGTNLIPSYSFGETDLLDSVPMDKIPKGSLIYYLVKFKNLFSGGINVYTRNALLLPLSTSFPKRIPVTILAGPVIEVEKVETPTRDQVEELHKKYIKALQEVYNNGRHYLSNPTAPLIIV